MARQRRQHLREHGVSLVTWFHPVKQGITVQIYFNRWLTDLLCADYRLVVRLEEI
jgi:hypothetical protein